MIQISPELLKPLASKYIWWKTPECQFPNQFWHPVTNAYCESLNRLIPVMNRLDRGYSFKALRVKILFTEGIPIGGQISNRMHDNIAARN